MTLKIAEIEDLEIIKQMAMNFVKVSGYEAFATEEHIESLILDIISGDKTKTVLILGEGGFIAGAVTNFPFGPVKVVTEIAWWVEPDQRKEGLGKELLDALEYWAKNVANCEMMTMTSLDSKIGKLYEKRGYKLYERAYMKVL
jgi:GNAT superfamily N-acetyltransferase